ncbi:MAG: phosphoketolase family protein [Roseovarius sp.]
MWTWAGTDDGDAPDVVLTFAGDVPTTEILAAADLLRRHLPDLKFRAVNVVDLMALAPPDEHPHGFDEKTFEALFPAEAPILFAFHGYRSLIRNLMFRRPCKDRVRIFGYVEEGTTTTPFDMAVLKGIDRYHLALHAIAFLPETSIQANTLRGFIRDKLEQHDRYIRQHGEDMPEVQYWRWEEWRSSHEIK